MADRIVRNVCMACDVAALHRHSRIPSECVSVPFSVCLQYLCRFSGIPQYRRTLSDTIALFALLCLHNQIKRIRLISIARSLLCAPSLLPSRLALNIASSWPFLCVCVCVLCMLAIAIVHVAGTVCVCVCAQKICLPLTSVVLLCCKAESGMHDPIVQIV